MAPAITEPSLLSVSQIATLKIISKSSFVGYDGHTI